MDKLIYLFAEAESVLVVSVVGSMVVSTAHIFERCVDEILSHHCGKIVLNFRDVSNRIDGTVVGALTRLMLQGREKNKEILLSSVHPEFREKLLKTGVVDSSKIVNNLNEAF